jgi:hypothetical protein
MSDEKKEIYESVSSEYKFTLENQLEAHRRIKQWNTDLTKINLLGIGAVLAGISITDLEVTLIFVGIIFSLAYSLWCSVRVFHPRKLVRGVSSEYYHEVQNRVSKNDMKPWEYYRSLSKTYSESVDTFPETQYGMVDLFLRALWASVTAFGFIVAYVILFSLPIDYHIGLESPLLFIIPIIALWGKDKSEGH